MQNSNGWSCLYIIQNGFLGVVQLKNWTFEKYFQGVRLYSRVGLYSSGYGNRNVHPVLF